jgi:hypothetical protein
MPLGQVAVEIFACVLSPCRAPLGGTEKRINAMPGRHIDDGQIQESACDHNPRRLSPERQDAAIPLKVNPRNVIVYVVPTSVRRHSCRRSALLR